MFPNRFFPRRYYPRRYFPPVGAAPYVLVYAPVKGVERLDLWTDVEQNGGQRIAVVLGYWGLKQSRRVKGEHTITFQVGLDHPATRLRTDTVDNFRINQVVRLVMGNGDFTEHRISEPTIANRKGARSRTVIARSIFQDLAFRGKIARTTADGARTMTFEVLGLTMRENLVAFIIPALVEAGQSFWVPGVMEHDKPIDATYEADTPMSGLLNLAIKGGDLELGYRRTALGYELDILARIGADAPEVVVRADANLLDLEVALRADDQATRVYALGGTFQDVRHSLGEAEWDVVEVTEGAEAGWVNLRLADPAGGDGPIRFDNQFIPEAPVDPDPDDETGPEAPTRYHLNYMTGGDFLAPIIATIAATQTMVVESAVMPPILPAPGVPLQRVRIVRDANLTENIYVDHPQMVADYGVRTADIKRDDIPATNNLVPNAIMRVWPTSSPLPTGWTKNETTGSTISTTQVSHEADPRFVEHGGASIRAYWPLGGGRGNYDQWVAAPVAVIPHRAQGYLSWFVRVTTVRGHIKIWALIARRATDLTGAASPVLSPTFTQRSYFIPTNTGQLDVTDIKIPEILNKQFNTAEDLGVQASWDLGRLPLYGGTVILGVSPALTPEEELAGTAVECECIIEAAQVTVSPEQMPLLPGSGGVRLHQAANERAGRYGSPAPTVSVNLIELLSVGTPLTLGGSVKVLDPDSGLEPIISRIMGWSGDPNSEKPDSVELSNERMDIATLLAQRARAARHGTFTVPDGTRALSYAT